MRRRTIGHRLFTDGTERPVYEDDQGQFVLDDDGQPLDGVWLVADEPDVVSQADRGESG